MRSFKPIGLIVVLVAGCALAAEPSTRPAVTRPVTILPGQQGAPSKIVAITVYQTSALVTREVVVPEGTGQFELVVGPLPPSTIDSSLYSEGNDGLRVLTTRFRTWVMQENVQEEVRKIDQQLKDIERDNQMLQQQIQTSTQNLAFMVKMEDFTQNALKQMTEKGMLNSESATKIAEFIMTTRQQRAADIVTTQQKITKNQEQTAYLQREREKVAAGSDKTIREAIIVVDKANAGPARAKLNYLVSAASWHPKYKLRASTAKDKNEVQLEYLAAIFQQSGEDWSDVDVVLSTAQPMLNAAPPELATLEVGVTKGVANAPAGGKGGQTTVNINGSIALKPNRGDNQKDQDQFRQEAVQMSNTGNWLDANKRYNDAAAIGQAEEIINVDREDLRARKQLEAAGFQEGQSVTFHLERRLTIPWRDDEQLIEVTRLGMKPDYLYKAVPVLTAHVYRLANLTNESKYVILPGEATMYIGTDFVGRSTLPLVAIGEQFTAGFGVDPQLQVRRELVDKTRATQGGNQVLKFDYRIVINSYKAEAVKLQVWDRLPHSDTEAVTITLLPDPKPELSKDPLYLREERPKNLLRWDMTIDPNQKGEKAATITYSYRIEFEKNAAIGNFLSR